MIEKPAQAGFFYGLSAHRLFGLLCGMRSLKSHAPIGAAALDTAWPWPNFSPAEMGCNHCGEGFFWPEFMDRLQALRDDIGRPLRIISAHRCALHNARVGGAPLSQHLKLAVDIGLHGHNPAALVTAAKAAGFKGFGYYSTFLHLDLGRPRYWYGSKRAELLWQTF